jgi:molybdopterin synthase sulfur carrier subunit
MKNSKANSEKITIKFFASLRQLTGVKELEKEIEPETTVISLLTEICETHPSLRDEVFGDKEHRDLQTWIIILLNGRNIKYLNRGDTKLRNKDVLALFPPTAGGSQNLVG